MEEVRKRRVLKSTGLAWWQIRAFFSAGILYLFYYFCKYNLSAATPDIQEKFEFSSETFGWTVTVFALVYAFGQFVNGFLGDRYGPKPILIIGAIGGVVVSLIFGIGDHIAALIGLPVITFFVICWAINGYFSSMGWAPVCRIIYNWFPENRWGIWMGWANFLCYFGAFLIYPLATTVVKHWGWRAAFIVSPACLLAMAIAFIFLGRSSPADAGLQAEWDRQDPEKPARRIGAREYWTAFRNPQMNLANLCGIGMNFVRWGLLSWGVKIFAAPVEEGGFGLDLVTAGWVTAMASLGGAGFSLVLGLVSDRVFKGIRWQTISIACLLSSGAIFFIAQGPPILEMSLMGISLGVPLLLVAMFIGGGLIQAAQTPLFDLPGDILGKELGGTGAGIMDGWLYIGAAFSGAYLGSILDQHGLTHGLTVMAVVSVVSGLLAVLIRR